jgi:hypothetical protein
MKKPASNQAIFFDGYDGQEDVVVDEFYGWIPYDLLCRMCDRYPLLVDTKGGAVQFCPKRIWITSNKKPEDWYKLDMSAMFRRLSGTMGQVLYIGPDMDQVIISHQRNDCAGAKRVHVADGRLVYDSDDDRPEPWQISGEQHTNPSLLAGAREIIDLSMATDDLPPPSECSIGMNVPDWG